MGDDRPGAASRDSGPAALTALALWLLLTIGWRPLMLPDEGRYTEVAWEMLRGDALVPTLFGVPFFHKPPLTYWINSLAMAVFGPHEAAARAAPAIGGWLLGLGLWWEVTARQGREVGPWALAILATMPFFFLGAQYANHDMLVAGCITMSVVCARQLQRTPQRLAWCLGAWTAAAAGVLSKGLIGIVLPALIVVPPLLWRRDWQALQRLLHPAGAVLFAAIALPWFVEMARRFPGFLDYFVLEQHFRRYASAHFNNPQPWWFYPPVMAALALPWTLWSWAAARRAWRGPAEAPAARADALDHVWWLAVVVVFFSAPRSKLVGYGLPALAPLAALLASTVCARPAWGRGCVAAGMALCLALVLGIRLHAPNSHQDVGLELGRHWRPGEPVLFVEAPFFDVPFYARMTQPPRVWSDWDDPDLPRRDNWRKELHDAARFGAPRAQVLVRTRDLPALLCGRAVVWIVAAADFRVPDAWGTAEPVLAGRHATLWKAAGSGGSFCP